MVRLLLVSFLAVGLLLGGAMDSEAAIESSVQRTLSVPETPVDTVGSGDGKLFFVLTSTSKVFVYADNGSLKGVLDVEGTPDLITSSPSGDLVFLTDKESGDVQILAVDFVQTISVAGAATKGALNGVVTVSIFSDFQ